MTKKWIRVQDLKRDYFIFRGILFLREPNLPRIQWHCDAGFFVISAFDRTFSIDDNMKRTDQLKKDVYSNGLEYFTLIGQSAHDENDNEDEVKELSVNAGRSLTSVRRSIYEQI